ncbi:MAG: hypothetical protein ACYDHF_06045 [Candidatus Cryosericum sp.]
MNHIGGSKAKPELDSQGKPVLNWMQQENSRTAFEIARDKVSRLELAFQTLESKAGVLTGFLAGILAASLGFVATNHPQSMPIGTLVAFSASVCLLLVCLLLLVLCLATHPWADAPGWRQFDNDEEYKRDPGRYRCQQVSNMRQSWDSNSAVLRTKGMLLKHALWFMLSGIMCLAVAGFMLTFQH